MEKETTDRRVRKTKKILRQCLVQLMKEKKIQQITVKELTDMADLNRGTFYLHYRDVFDLLEQLENELFEEFNQVVNRYPSKQSRESLGEHLPFVFEDIYQFILENQDFISILLGENGDFNFSERLNSIIRDKCFQDWKYIFSSADPARFAPYYSFMVSGCVGLVQYWIRNGLKETPKELSAITGQIILHGIKVLD